MNWKAYYLVTPTGTIHSGCDGTPWITDSLATAGTLQEQYLAIGREYLIRVGNPYSESLRIRKACRIWNKATAPDKPRGEKAHAAANKCARKIMRWLKEKDFLRRTTENPCNGKMHLAPFNA